MYGLCHFYNKIRHAMHTSFKKHIDVLPPFGKLSTVSNIRNLLVPENPNHIGYTTIQSVYEWFGNTISNLLFDNNVINQKRTPRAYRIIITLSSTDDGWDLLFNLLSKRCPFLGCKTMDVSSEITLLQINNDDNIHTFFKRVQDIQTKLQYSRESIDKTRLISFYLKAIGTSFLYFPLLQGFMSELNQHISKNGTNVSHPLMTCLSIHEYLLSIDAPENFVKGSHPQTNKCQHYLHNKAKYTTTTKIAPNILV